MGLLKSLPYDRSEVAYLGKKQMSTWNYIHKAENILDSLVSYRLFVDSIKN